MSQQSLASIQRQLLTRIRSGAGGELPDSIAQGPLSGRKGLEIYAHAYGARLREALGTDHAVLGSYLGDELWEQMCEGYIAAHPSTVRSLRDFGVHLPTFLAGAKPFSAHPVIAELATFELRLLDCFDSIDANRADWSQLLTCPQLDWPSLQIRFHPSLVLHAVAFNSVEIWRALKEDQDPPAAEAVTDAAWAIWRDADGITRFRSVGAGEAAALQLALRGGAFHELCELLLAWQSADKVPELALGYLQRWCADGWITHWQTAEVA